MEELNKVTSRRDFRPGDIIKHFKREEVESEIGTTYSETYHMYRILEMNAIHTETGEKYVVYQSLYPENRFETFIRPKDNFLSEVDHEKYPNIKQKYRVELVQR